MEISVDCITICSGMSSKCSSATVEVVEKQFIKLVYEVEICSFDYSQVEKISARKSLYGEILV